jgi:hypothetical protein
MISAVSAEHYPTETRIPVRFSDGLRPNALLRGLRADAEVKQGGDRQRDLGAALDLLFGEHREHAGEKTLESAATCDGDSSGTVESLHLELY